MDFYANATTVDSEGASLRVAQFGPDDGEPVLLLHGWPDSGELWSEQAAPLAEAGYRVIAPDQRGFGDSEKPTGIDAYGLSKIAADAGTVLDTLGVDAAHVVGHDWGAAVAWGLACFDASRVRSLTAISVGHPASFAAAGLGQRKLSWYMLAFQFPGTSEEWLMRDDWAILREFLASHPRVDRVLSDLARPGALTASLNWYRANASPEIQLGAPRRIPPAQGDVMGIWSSGDLALTETQMTGSAAHVTGRWRYERIEDASHWVQLEQPGRVSELLLDWLAQH